MISVQMQSLMKSVLKCQLFGAFFMINVSDPFGCM